MNSVAQQFANDVNAACPLIEAPSQESAAWDCVSGLPVREYFTKSPYATVEAYVRGFVVHNLVTGGRHPAPTWNAAVSIRSAIAGRYQAISGGFRS